MKRAALVVFFLVCLGCSGRREATKLEPPPPGAPAPLNTATEEPAPDAGSSAEAGVAFANVGRFRPRVLLEVGDRVSCMAMLEELDVLPNGQAWVVGGCGIRFRVDSAGVDDFRAPPKPFQFQVAGQTGNCVTTSAFWGVYARSDHEAYVVGDFRCGMDPNTIWYLPLEKFDGKKWASTKVPFGNGVHDGLPWELEGNDRLLYTLVEGDDWHGPPECALHPFSKGRWSKAELVCPMPKGPDDRVMVLRDLEVTADGTLWVAGSVLMHGQPTSGMLWKKSQADKAWTEIPIDDVALAGVSVGSDGAVFAVGKSLWKVTAGKAERASEGKAEVSSLWVQSAERVWLVRNGAPVVYMDGVERPVEIEASAESLERIHGSGEHVWAISQSRVWQLQNGGASAVPVSLRVDTPTE